MTIQQNNTAKLITIHSSVAGCFLYAAFPSPIPSKWCLFASEDIQFHAREFPPKTRLYLAQSLERTPPTLTAAVSEDLHIRSCRTMCKPPRCRLFRKTACRQPWIKTNFVGVRTCMTAISFFLRYRLKHCDVRSRQRESNEETGRDRFRDEEGGAARLLG